MAVIEMHPRCRHCKQPAVAMDTEFGDCYCKLHFVEQQTSAEPLTYFRSVA